VKLSAILLSKHNLDKEVWLMSAAKVIKQLMVERDVSVKELSERLGMKNPQLLSNKLYRDTFTYSDYIKIVNMLDCTVQTVTNDTAKIFTNEYEPASNEG
jgi:DNA-binding Xre family transcriptional regulator